MYKKMIALILTAVFAAALTSCASNNVTAPTQTDPAIDNTRQNEPVNPLIITDEDGTELGRIDDLSAITAVRDGIFYSVFTLDEDSYTGTAEYRFFSLKDKTDVYLGELEDQGYEAAFARAELDGTVYTLAVKGDPAGEAAVPLLLLAFDTADKTMRSFTVSAYGFPYAAMTASNGKLIIMNHETSADKKEKIYEFDPDTGTITEILAFDSSADSLRSVCAADNGFYLLRLKLNTGAENEMFVDLYDDNYDKISETSVNDILINAITEVHGISGRQDALNEIGMNVSRFFMTGDGCMIYENFGLSRVAVNLNTKETIIAKDDNYAVSGGSGAPLIYRIDYAPDTAAAPEIYGIGSGELSRVSFTPDEGHKLLQTVTISADGILAILSSDAFPVQNGTGVVRILTAR